MDGIEIKKASIEDAEIILQLRVHIKLIIITATCNVISLLLLKPLSYLPPGLTRSSVTSLLSLKCLHGIGYNSDFDFEV
jgi:hypothetical protein